MLTRLQTEDEPDETQMLDIPGIDAVKVGLYGKQFLKIVREFHQAYEEMIQQQEDRPQDPNHENVINISSDEEYADGAEDEDSGDEDDAEGQRSSYFQQPSEVAAFNRQCK